MRDLVRMLGVGMLMGMWVLMLLQGLLRNCLPDHAAEWPLAHFMTRTVMRSREYSLVSLVD